MARSTSLKSSVSERLRAHLSIARLDHSIKNIFVLPGIIVPLSVYPGLFNLRLIYTLLLALISMTLVACSNYVINEVLDARFDRLHPVKRNRPAARGLVNIGAAYAQWLLMVVAGIAIGLLISRMFALTALALWIMGCLYNFPPVRTKDVPYLDVITESINNPLRMLLGWYAVTSVLIPPVSLLIAYWMLGCYFMALKRFSELSEIKDRGLAGAYRASFKHYTPQSLLVSVLFYASAGMLFLGAFIIRYRIELILGFPLIALTMAIYLNLAFKPGSAVQNPEKLYREPLLMASFTATALAMCLLLFIRIPLLERFFLPTLPQSPISSATQEAGPARGSCGDCVLRFRGNKLQGNSSMKTSENLSESARSAKAFCFSVRSIPLPAFAFLALTATIALLLSHESLMWFDEFLVLWTDSAPNIGKLIHLQLTSPISLHPLAYHVIEYLAIRLAGAGAFAIRLPSVFGYLLMQVCLFIFVRRFASERAAIFALAFPALTSTLIFAAQGTPYALLLGWFGLAMVAWQAAARGESQRTLALVTLALAIALAINTHYFGILLLAPLMGAELYRSFQRRKLAFAIAASIGTGMTGILLLLPSMKAVAEFRNHYYISELANPKIIAGAYLSILPGYGFTQRHEAIGALFLAVVALACLWSCLRQIRGSTIIVPGAEVVFVMLMAALPFFGYLLAAVETHSIAVRFVEGGALGVTPLLAIALAPLLRRRKAGRFVLIAIFAAIALVGGMHIHAARNKAQRTMSTLTPTTDIKAALMAAPNKPIYFEGAYRFSVVSYYEPDPGVRSRIALVYSRDQELQWKHGDTSSLTALHMRMFTGYTIVPYETLARESGDHLFVVFPGMDDDWTSQAFAASHADVRPLGPAFGGELISVRFHP